MDRRKNSINSGIGAAGAAGVYGVSKKRQINRQPKIAEIKQKGIVKTEVGKAYYAAGNKRRAAKALGQAKGAEVKAKNMTKQGKHLRRGALGAATALGAYAAYSEYNYRKGR